MRGVSIVEWGAPPVAGEVPEPAPAPGRAIVRMRAAGLNPVDLAIASGRFYMPIPDPPFVAGAECMGEVISSSTVPAGTRVWCLPVTGAFGELVSAPEASLAPVPDGLDDVTAGGLGVAGLAGWMPVRHRGRLAPGETVVVLGAGGAVGRVAIQAARLGGARWVVAVARSAAGREAALALGADVALPTGPGLPEALREACGEGADLVIDPLWGDSAAAAIGALRLGGRLVQVGNSESPSMQVVAGPLRGRLIEILGFSTISEDSATVARAYGELAAVVLAGEVSVEVEPVRLDDAPAAWSRLAQGAAGRKLVLVP